MKKEDKNIKPFKIKNNRKTEEQLMTINKVISTQFIHNNSELIINKIERKSIKIIMLLTEKVKVIVQKVKQKSNNKSTID